MTYLKARSRIVALLKLFAVLTGFSLLAFVPTLLGGRTGWFDLRLPCTIALGCTSVAVSVALAMGGFFVRRKFGSFRFVLWLIPLLLIFWALIMTPIAVIEAPGNDMAWQQILGGTLIGCTVTVVLLLPILLFSFWQPLYRSRLVDWLKAEPTPHVDMAPPPMATELSTR
jgi:hypothetical protein